MKDEEARKKKTKKRKNKWKEKKRKERKREKEKKRKKEKQKNRKTEKQKKEKTQAPVKTDAVNKRMCRRIGEHARQRGHGVGRLVIVNDKLHGGMLRAHDGAEVVAKKW